jgi:hypothetical protein
MLLQTLRGDVLYHEETVPREGFPNLGEACTCTFDDKDLRVSEEHRRQSFDFVTRRNAGNLPTTKNPAHRAKRIPKFRDTALQTRKREKKEKECEEKAEKRQKAFENKATKFSQKNETI